LLHLDPPHGPADVNDEHNVFRKRGEFGRREEVNKVTVGDLGKTLEAYVAVASGEFPSIFITILT